MKKGSDKGAFIISSEIVHSRTLAVQNSLVFRDGALEVVGIVKVVRIQSIGVVNLQIVDFHFNIGKKLSAICCLQE